MDPWSQGLIWPLRAPEILTNLLTSLGLLGNIKDLIDDCDEHLQHDD
jgi:hypothetical protein